MIFHKQEKLKAAILGKKDLKYKIGLVPTMGALHHGHLALVRKALEFNQIVVVSIFVNPTQFDNATDLQKYPRTLEKDVALLKTVDKNILVYAPAPEDLYGDQIVSKKFRFGGLEKQMEGKYRQGHFDGVGTVVSLLLRAVNPHNAYFGEKDFQQLQIIKKLVQIENIPVKIVGCKIERESHGLAMSSRNERLPQELRHEAKLLFECLNYVKRQFSEKSIRELQNEVRKRFEQQPEFELEYIEIAPVETLKPAIRKRTSNRYRAFIAAFAGEVRLIDNMALN